LRVTVSRSLGMMVSETVFAVFELNDKFRSLEEAEGCNSIKKDVSTTEMRGEEYFRGIKGIVYIKI
jgi:hypothetical protein